MNLYTLYALGAILLSLLILAGFLLLNSHRWPEWFKKPVWVSPHPHKLTFLFHGIVQFPGHSAVKLLFLSLVHSLTYLTQFALLLCAFVDLTITKAFTIATATLFTKTLMPIAIGDLGIRESAAIFFGSHYGVAPAAAFNASMLLFFINILLPSLIGLGLILKSRVLLTSKG